jgi:hypothetical protein
VLTREERLQALRTISSANLLGDDPEAHDAVIALAGSADALEDEVQAWEKRFGEHVRQVGINVLACARFDRLLGELRELVLDYDPGQDRGGARWDDLRIDFDRRLTELRKLVLGEVKLGEHESFSSVRPTNLALEAAAVRAALDVLTRATFTARRGAEPADISVGNVWRVTPFRVGIGLPVYQHQGIALASILKALDAGAIVAHVAEVPKPWIAERV